MSCTAAGQQGAPATVRAHDGRMLDAANCCDCDFPVETEQSAAWECFSAGRLSAAPHRILHIWIFSPPLREINVQLKRLEMQPQNK